jgi:hypothetical protein
MLFSTLKEEGRAGYSDLLSPLFNNLAQVGGFNKPAALTRRKEEGGLCFVRAK